VPAREDQVLEGVKVRVVYDGVEVVVVEGESASEQVEENDAEGPGVGFEVVVGASQNFGCAKSLVAVYAVALGSIAYDLSLVKPRNSWHRGLWIFCIGH
jgi:hypothetical protein